MIETPFTQVPNHFLTRLPELNRGEVVLMFCIYRNTLGYHRQQVSMTLTEVMRRTGLSRQSVLNARSNAIEHGLLVYTLKDGVIFWEPILQTSCEGSLKNRPEAVQNVDHADETVQNIDCDGLKNRPEAVQNVDRAGETVQNIDCNGLKNRPEAVQNLDPLLNKDLNKDLKKEREGKTARPVFEDDFNFERLPGRKPGLVGRVGAALQGRGAPLGTQAQRVHGQGGGSRRAGAEKHRQGRRYFGGIRGKL